MTTTCEFCGSDKPYEKMSCRQCYYGGKIVERNLAGAIVVLNEAAKRAGHDPAVSVWQPQHTGGGCFSLELALGGNDEAPLYLMLTETEGPLHGSHTIAELDASGWCLGAYRGEWGGDDWKTWDNLATEQVPMLISEAIQWALNEGNTDG